MRQVDKLVHLTINGEEIVTTDNHPFYVQNRGSIDAGKLLVGDKLISVNGEDLSVDSCYTEECKDSVTVYNFKVKDYHTYFVGENKVWVHNAECVNVSTKDLEPTHNQTKSNRQMNKLIEQIKKDGGIKEPIKYVEYNGKMYVVDGHHRLIAAKKLGLENVPAQQVELPFAGYRTVDDLNFDYY